MAGVTVIPLIVKGVFYTALDALGEYSSAVTFTLKSLHTMAENGKTQNYPNLNCQSQSVTRVCQPNLGTETE